MIEDTIVAISTALGVGAISIIRISGTDAISITNSIFKGKDLEKVASHTINYGHIMHNNEIIDEVLVSVMKAPKTYTTENIVEINCHGGIATTNKILNILLNKGCRLAEYGEFTKRAFLNGRIDLLKAQGIMDLIESKTEQSRKLAINQLSGVTTNYIKELRQEILEIIAHIEVNIDFPEYEDIEEKTSEQILKDLINIELKLKKIMYESQNAKIVREGINVVILGKPNVGKSSILNRLLNENKAIVTNIAGTTRDIVEGQIILDGIVLNIIDTAGIRETDDLVEKLGVEKSKELMKSADLILFIINNNEEITEEETEIINLIGDKNHIIIKNKNDLPKLNNYNEENCLSINTNDDSIDVLKNKIKEIFDLEKIECNDQTYLTNARSLALLDKCYQNVNNIKETLKLKMPIDIIEIDLKDMWNLLGEIIGETYKDDLITQLFSQFCLGK